MFQHIPCNRIPVGILTEISNKFPTGFGRNVPKTEQNGPGKNDLGLFKFLIDFLLTSNFDFKRPFKNFLLVTVMRVPMAIFVMTMNE